MGKQQSVRPALRMKKSLSLLISLQLLILSSAAQNEECPVGTSKFSGQSDVCVSLLDFCLGQGRVVRNDWCGERCVPPKIPDPNGEACRDDSEILRPVLMMTELKEMMETQLIDLRERLSSRGLSGAIRDIEQIPSLAGLTNSRDQGITSELMTDALAKLYTVQDSDILLTTNFRFLKDQVEKRVGNIEKALYDTQSGKNRIKSALRNIRRLHRDFLSKIKDINDDIKVKQDTVTAALTKVAVFNEMLAGVKQNRRNLNKLQLTKDLFSKIKTTFVEVDNEWKKNGTQKAVDKTLDSLPRLINIGVSLFSSSTAHNEREIKDRIERSLKAVGAVSSRLSSANWELIQFSGSFVAAITRNQELKDEEFHGISGDLMADALSRCRDMVELAERL